MKVLAVTVKELFVNEVVKVFFEDESDSSLKIGVNQKFDPVFLCQSLGQFINPNPQRGLDSMKFSCSLKGAAIKRYL